jgi:hypothetical protein
MPEGTNVGTSKSSSFLFYIGAFVIIVLFVSATFLLRKSGPRQKESSSPDKTTEFTTGGDVLRFAQNCFYLTSGSQTLRVEFVKAHRTMPERPAGRRATHRPRFLQGNPGDRSTRPARWKTGANPVSQIVYSNLWDGVTVTYDVTTAATARSIYELEPGSKPEDIRLHYDLPVTRQSDGSLRVVFQSASLNQSAPRAWQESDGVGVPVQAAFVQSGEHDVGFTIEQYDRSLPLFIRFNLELEHPSQPQ